MSAVERRNELIKRLICRRKDTVPNLAFEFGVSQNTIRRDIAALTMEYPLITISGNGGGVMVEEWYHPHRNILSREQSDVLQRLMEKTDEYERKVLAGMLEEYGKQQIAV